jgi:enoyl-CoA hydratase/carnithine racemase
LKNCQSPGFGRLPRETGALGRIMRFGGEQKSMSDHVRVEQSAGVLAITLARPERRNAITVDMYMALADAFEQASQKPSIRVVTIAGEGQDFAAGNDLADFLDASAREGGEIPVWRFLRALAGCDIPIVAAVHGNCVGIGTTMLLHCDLVIAEEGARFSLPFVDLGLVPEAASSLLLPRLAGRRRAARYLLLGEPFGVDEAETIGLISHRVPAGELAGALDRTVRALLAKPPEALRQTRRLLRHGARDEIHERMQLESARFTERLASPEVGEAIAAFFERRKPDFSGLA